MQVSMWFDRAAEDQARLDEIDALLTPVELRLTGVALLGISEGLEWLMYVLNEEEWADWFLVFLLPFYVLAFWYLHRGFKAEEANRIPED